MARPVNRGGWATLRRVEKPQGFGLMNADLLHQIYRFLSVRGIVWFWCFLRQPEQCSPEGFKGYAPREVIESHLLISLFFLIIRCEFFF
jgi:hypothetical protein